MHIFVQAARSKSRKLMVMTFSSMPVARDKALGVAVEMLAKSKHDFSLLYVGKRQSDTPSAKTAAAAADFTAKGKLLEVERADFGLLFREMDAFVVHGGLGTTVEALRMRKPTVVTGGRAVANLQWHSAKYGEWSVKHVGRRSARGGRVLSRKKCGERERMAGAGGQGEGVAGGEAQRALGVGGETRWSLSHRAAIPPIAPRSYRASLA